MNEAAFVAHLKTGSTTVCRAWQVVRKDGHVLGFTDHDRDLVFDGVTFVARSGLTARALQQSTGLAVDNTEAAGALSDDSVREEDILAGRFDGAEVTAFIVNWANVPARAIVFKGHFGDITRSKGAFQVELRGLTERLNLPDGRVYHADCSAVLGDKACTIDLSLAAHSCETPILSVEGGRIFHVAPAASYDADWFVKGRFSVLDGVGRDQTGIIKSDRVVGTVRVIELWQGFTSLPVDGDMVRLEAGCDKRGRTCRDKFANFLNFRGFPHIPGEDWLRAAPGTARGA